MATEPYFKKVLAVSDKVNDAALRKSDLLQDEIVLERLLVRRSLQQCKQLGRAPWIFPGMNGPFKNLNRQRCVLHRQNH